MEKKSDNIKKGIAAVKFSVLILIVIGLTLFIFFYHKDILTEFSSFEEAAALLRKYRGFSVPVYIAAEVLQILVFILPGQVFQFAAGYVYGFLPGLLYTFVGALLGTAVTFWTARLLGKDAAGLIIGPEKYERYTSLLSSRRALLITFIIYLVPGLPKDAVCYAAGLSGIRSIPFLIISVTGRMPAMAASIIFGSMYMKSDYTGMLVTGAAVLIISLICILSRKSIISYIDKLYSKYV